MTEPCTGCGIPICPPVCPQLLRSTRAELHADPCAVIVESNQAKRRDRQLAYRSALEPWLLTVGLPSCLPPPAPEPRDPHEPDVCVQCTGSPGEMLPAGIPVEICDCCDLPYCAACAHIVLDDLWLCEDCNRGRCTCLAHIAAQRLREDVATAVFQPISQYNAEQAEEKARRQYVNSHERRAALCADHAGQLPYDELKPVPLRRATWLARLVVGLRRCRRATS